MTYMVPSPNGGIFDGANLAASPTFIIFYTLLAQSTGNVGDYGTPNAEQNTQILFETIQTLSNVKYINITNATVDLSVSGNRAIYGFGTNFNQASTVIYSVKFMVEQPDYVTAANLGALIEANAAVVPFATTGVPTSGGAVSLTEYEVTSSSTTNTVVNVYTALV